MSHYLINPTWRCQNACSYCWVRQTVLQRPELVHATERTLDDWVRAIQRDKPQTVDIAGGEPMLLPWIPELIRACTTTRFGLSTNGLAFDQLERLCEISLRNLVSINVSWHPECVGRWRGYEQRWKTTVQMLMQAGYTVGPNVVDVGTNVEQSQGVIEWMRVRRIPFAVSPHERMDNLDQKLAQGLLCQGGVNHLTVAPDGEAWPCLTTLRSPFWAETSLGNWLDGTVDVSRKPQPCTLNCVDYYVLPQLHQAGDMWQIQARPA
jgi:organic radical activating enzyme